MLMTVKAVSAGDGAAEATKWSLEFQADGDDPTNVMDDMWCDSTLLEGQYSSTACYEDILDAGGKTGATGTEGANDWTNAGSAGDNYCTETWLIATTTDSTPTTTYADRCVKMQFKGSRKFITGDNDAAGDTTKMFDVDLGYRKYSMTAGWTFSAQATPASTEPGLIHFDP